MSNFTKLKVKNGNRVRADLDKALFFVEEDTGTKITFPGQIVLVVEESFQTVSNRTKSTEAAEPVQA